MTDRTETKEATAAPTEVDVVDVVEHAYDPLVEDAPDAAVDQEERRALVIGEALIDIARRADGAVSEHPGGSPANVALGLGRLGRGVDLLTWFGRDAHGRLLTDHLAAYGVMIVPGSDGASRTSVAAATQIG